MSQSQIGYTPAGLMAIQKYLTGKNHFRLLDKEDQAPAIATGCPTLDWMTDCGGIPRGRVIEVAGIESSGKCVTLDTLVPIPGQGLRTMQELLGNLPWKKDPTGEYTLSDQSVPVEFPIHTSQADPTDVNGAYFAGNTETTVIHTELGHKLRGTPTHRVLVLPDNGILRWVHLKDTRPGDLVITSFGHKAAGPIREICGLTMPSDDPGEPEHDKKIANARLLGVLAACEMRSGEMHLLTTSTKVVRFVQDWAIAALTPEADPFDEALKDFTRFSGLAKIREGAWTTLAQRAIQESPDLIRQSSITAQAAYAGAIFISRGNWTGSDLEIELANLKVGETLHAILDNIGVRTYCYDCLNTFSESRKKLALYDRLSQQAAQDILWDRIPLPSSWQKQYVVEQSETNDRVQKTLERARDIYVKGRSTPARESRVAVGQLAFVDGGESLVTFPLVVNEIDVEDTDKENLIQVAELIRPFCKSQTDSRIYDTLILLGQAPVGLERISNTEKSTPAPTADLSVPIGHHYATNSIISHNSTLCMHLCNVEMARNPDAICVYQDYERSTATPYARKMGLHKHLTPQGLPRFHLIPSDTFEEADDYVKQYFKSGIVPSIWVCDSVPAMVPQAMFERDSEDNPQIALQARMMADLLARWIKIAADYGTTFIMINQIRAHISTGFGDKARGIPGVAGSDKESSPGGNAIKFYCSMRLDLRPKSVVKAKSFNPMTGEVEEMPIANLVKATSKKNKCGSPFRSGVFYITFGEGIDTVRTMLDLGLRKGVITKDGSGRFNLDLPTGEKFNCSGQAEFLQLLKHGPNSKQIQSYLNVALQWDRATEIAGEVLGLEVEDAETGERSNAESMMSGSAIAGKLQMVRSQVDLMMQAEALDLLTKDRRAIQWTNPNNNETFRGGNHDSLGKKIKGADRQVLQGMVDAAIKSLTDQIAAENAKVEQAKVAVNPVNVSASDDPLAHVFAQSPQLVSPQVIEVEETVDDTGEVTTELQNPGGNSEN